MAPDAPTRPALSDGVFGVLGLVVPAVVWTATGTRVLSSGVAGVAAVAAVVLVAVVSAWRVRSAVPAGVPGETTPVARLQSSVNGLLLLVVAGALSGGLCLLAGSLTGLVLLVVLASSALGRAAGLITAERRADVVVVEDDAVERYRAVRR